MIPEVCDKLSENRGVALAALLDERFGVAAVRGAYSGKHLAHGSAAGAKRGGHKNPVWLNGVKKG
jgi:hypothetical protein